MAQQEDKVRALQGSPTRLRVGVPLQEAYRKCCPTTALFRESDMEFEDEWRIVRPRG